MSTVGRFALPGARKNSTFTARSVAGRVISFPWMSAAEACPTKLDSISSAKGANKDRVKAFMVWSAFSWGRGNPQGERRHKANDARNDENPKTPSSARKPPQRLQRPRAAIWRGGDCHLRRGRGEPERVLLRPNASLFSPASRVSRVKYSPGGGVPYRFAAAA